MHGVVVSAVKELVVEKFGEGSWYKALSEAGIPASFEVSANSEVPDDAFYKVAEAICKVQGLSFIELADAFGDYWVNVYALRIFGVFYKGKTTAKEFILNMNYVHDDIVRRLVGTHPPKFEYNKVDDRTLDIKYISERKLIDIAAGLFRGVGKYYKEDLTVTKLSEDKIRIEFP